MEEVLVIVIVPSLTNIVGLMVAATTLAPSVATGVMEIKLKLLSVIKWVVPLNSVILLQQALDGVGWTSYNHKV